MIDALIPAHEPNYLLTFKEVWITVFRILWNALTSTVQMLPKRAEMIMYRVMILAAGLAFTWKLGKWQDGKLLLLLCWRAHCETRIRGKSYEYATLR